MSPLCVKPVYPTNHDFRPCRLIATVRVVLSRACVGQWRNKLSSEFSAGSVKYVQPTPAEPLQVSEGSKCVVRLQRERDRERETDRQTEFKC